jgi:hypothetical protein
VVYDEVNKAQKFDKLTITQFVKGFNKVTRTQDMKRAEIRAIVLEEIMEDAESHPWELVPAAHAILLQQIESARASWEDHSNRKAIRRSHIHWPLPPGSLTPRRAGTAMLTASRMAVEGPHQHIPRRSPI